MLRTNKGTPHRSVSTNNGVTFSEPAPVADVISSLSDSQYARDPAMDLDNWEGDNARWNEPMLRVICTHRGNVNAEIGGT